MIGKASLAGLTALLVTACTGQASAPQPSAAAQAGLDRELAGLTPHETTSCITLRPTQQTKGYGPTIVYVVDRRLKYRSDTSGGCEALGHGDVLVTRTPTTQICQGDIATTIDSASRTFSGSCAFGPFTRYSAK